MADIRIEKKEKSSSILPWIIGLLVLGLALWFLSGLFDKDDVDHVEEINTEQSAVKKTDDATYSLINWDSPEGRTFNDSFDEYDRYTAEMTGDMGLDHEFSHNALNLLATSTSSLARAVGMGSEVNINAEERKIREAADYITKDPLAGDHADKIRDAANAIVRMLTQIQEAKFPGLEGAVEDVRAAAQDISKETLTLQQKEDVRDFFGKAKVVLKGMRDQAQKR